MKRLALPLILALTIPALAACSTSPAADGILIVASTNVYGSIASAVAGDRATVVSIISEPSQDPHSYEAGARVQLELSRADIVIANGGGYDDFVDTLLAGAGNPDATILKAVRDFGISAAPPGPEFNEHVWYDLPTMARLAGTLADVLSERDPDHADGYRANAATFTASIGGLESRVAALAAAHAGDAVIMTEPVPFYLLEAAGLDNVTPDAFSQAIEDGTGVPPALLGAMLDLLAEGTVSGVVYNEQTSGPETDQLLEAARAAGVPVIPVTETLPADTDYVAWMSTTIDALEAALQ